MNEEPLVTINILSFNRKDELKNTLIKVFEQSYKNIEVIVVDNASSDSTLEMIEQEFPTVNLIKLEKNIGIAGWNEGFKNAKGKYILVLDDDSFPDIDTIANGIEILSNKPEAGIIAFNIRNLRYNFSETKDFPLHPLSFNGCGAIIRKEVIEKVGYYNELIFIYLNELDFSARCYDCDFDIIYEDGISVFHNQSLGSRGNTNSNPFQSGYRYFHFFRSMTIFLVQYFYMKYVLIYLPKWLLNRIIICIKYNFYKEFFKAMKDILLLLPKISRKNVLKHEVQERYDFGNFFPLIDRDYFPNFSKPKWL